MDSTNLQILPAPPSLMKSLMAGFDAVSNHIGIILFPIALDLLLWFFPRIRLTKMLQSLSEQSALAAGASGADVLERLESITESLNLLSTLRTFPIGVSSLLASRPPAASPLGAPFGWEAPSLGYVIGLWLFITVLGILAGALYFTFVAQAALFDKIQWRLALRQWPWASWQTFTLTAFWFGLLSTTIFPFFCFFSFMLTGNIGLEQFVMFGIVIFSLLWVWLLLPFFFSPHGIFGAGEKMWISLRNGARLARATLPSTGLLVLVIIVISEGLRMLWILPEESSWWMLVGITGHAFVTTSLLAASFVFYRDSAQWVEQMRKKTGTTA